MIEKIPVIPGSEEWRRLREPDITASTAPAILCVHPYISPLGLYLLKAGIIKDDPEETPPMRRGRLLEPVAIQMLREDHPDWIDVGSPGAYYRDPDARVGATPDCLAFDGKRGLGVIQIKSVERSVFRRTWRDEDGEIAPPLYPVIQANIEAHMTGAEWAAVAALVVSHGIDIHLIEVPIHAGIIERVYAETRAFLDRVARKDPPPPDFGRDGALIAKLFSQSNGEVLDLAHDNMLPILAVEDAHLAGEIKKQKERRDAIKAELLAKLGAASGATFQGGFVSAKTRARKAYQVAASSYRDVRIKLETPA